MLRFFLVSFTGGSAASSRPAGLPPPWQISSMCNTYRIQPKRQAACGLAARIAEVTQELESPLIRKSDPAPVVRAGGVMEIMRWGFHREFNPAINNARADKLEGGMWREAFHKSKDLKR